MEPSCMKICKVLFSFAVLGTALPLQANAFENAVLKWFDRINISGALEITGLASNVTPTTVGLIPNNLGSSPAASDIATSYANLTAEARIASWLSGVIKLSYQESSPSFIRSAIGGGDIVLLDNGYIVVAEPECSPLYFKVGRQLLDFGGLDDSSKLESTTQLLSLTRVITAKLGFNDWYGLNGQVYVFRGLKKRDEFNTTSVENIGVALGYNYRANEFKFNLGAGYLNNLVSGLYPSSTVANGSLLNSGFYTDKVPGLDLHAKIALGAFDLSAKYINALSSFSVNDVPYTQNGGVTFIGAKPSAWGFNGGYTFNVSCMETRLAIGYQGSREAVALGSASASVANSIAGIYGPFFAIGMPESRFYANYKMNLYTWASLIFELARDGSYGVIHGGTAHDATIGLIDLAVSF